MSGTAFVLSGGGSHGVVQVGMAKALLDIGIRPDVIVGSSVGALNAVAMGRRWDLDNVVATAEIWERAESMSLLRQQWFGVMRRAFTRCPSLLDPLQLQELLSAELGHLHFAELEVPVLVAATNLATGSERVFESGSVLEPLMASCAVPGFLPPVSIDGGLFVDGLVHGAPVRQALARGFDRIFVMLCNPPRVTIAREDWYSTARRAATNIMNRHLTDMAVTDGMTAEIRILPGVAELQGRSRRNFAGSRSLVDCAYRLTYEWALANSVAGA